MGDKALLGKIRHGLRTASRSILLGKCGHSKALVPTVYGLTADHIFLADASGKRTSVTCPIRFPYSRTPVGDYVRF